MNKKVLIIFPIVFAMIAVGCRETGTVSSSSEIPPVVSSSEEASEGISTSSGKESSTEIISSSESTHEIVSSSESSEEVISSSESIPEVISSSESSEEIISSSESTPEVISSSESSEEVISSSESSEEVVSSSESSEYIPSSESSEDISSSESSEYIPDSSSEQGGESSSESESSSEHQHQAGSTWYKDTQYHWHVCTGCDEILDKDEHSWDAGVITTKPTYDAAGIKTYTCTVCGETKTEEVDPLEHHYAEAWSSDENKHWHACTDAGFESLKSGEADHNFGNAVFTSEVDYSTYKKGYNTYTCSVCGRTKKENVYYTKAEMAALMNAFIANKDYFDVFEMRDALVTQGYPVSDFGYKNNAIVEYAANSGITPFKATTVNTLSELNNAISSISIGTADYSVIKLNANITTSESIVINSKNPVEIDLCGHTIDYTADKSGAIKVDKLFYQKPVVAIVNGTIRTKEISGGADLTKSPSCVSLYEAESLRLSNLTLVNRAERGYSFIDSYYGYTEGTLKIDNSTLRSPLVALCLQRNENEIYKNEIYGAVVINGGVTLFKENTVDVTNIQDQLSSEATEFISDGMLYDTAYETYVTKGYDTFMVTATDAVLVYDRRSVNSTYGTPEVEFNHNILKCKYKDNTPYGYGFRYMDLNLDPNKDSNAMELGLISGYETNTYPYHVGSTAYQTHGGYEFYHSLGA